MEDLLNEVIGLAAYLKNCAPDVVANNLDTAVVPTVRRVLKALQVREVEMQDLIDVGLNAFALQLFAESVALKTDAKTFEPFAFNFRGIRVSLAPIRDVDTRHH